MMPKNCEIQMRLGPFRLASVSSFKSSANQKLFREEIEVLSKSWTLGWVISIRICRGEFVPATRRSSMVEPEWRARAPSGREFMGAPLSLCRWSWRERRRKGAIHKWCQLYFQDFGPAPYRYQIHATYHPWVRNLPTPSPSLLTSFMYGPKGSCRIEVARRLPDHLHDDVGSQPCLSPSWKGGGLFWRQREYKKEGMDRHVRKFALKVQGRGGAQKMSKWTSLFLSLFPSEVSSE